MESLRDVFGNDALGKAFDDGGFADAGFADQDRVVFGAAGEDLEDAADFFVAADDRVEFAFPRFLGEVDCELIQRVLTAVVVVWWHLRLSVHSLKILLGSRSCQLLSSVESEWGWALAI